MKCPCNPKKEYLECCSLAHRDFSNIKTAEQLMRSRYSAFVLGIIDYLQLSHHSLYRPSSTEATEIKKWTNSVDWIRLEVLNVSSGLERDSFGYVEFKAFFSEKGKIDCIHEHSKFCKENGNWVYLNEVS